MNRVFIFWFVIAALLFVVQTALMPFLAWDGITADLLLLMTLSYSFFRGAQMGTLMGFFLGAMQDLDTGTFFGINIFPKMVLGYLCGSFANNLFRERGFLPILTTAAGTAAEYFIQLVIVLLLGYKFNVFINIERTLLPMMCWNLLLAYPVFGLIHWAVKKTRDT